MKALYKSQLIQAINTNFNNDSLIFEDSNTLKEIFKQLGHDWHIEGSRWTETKWNEKWDKVKEEN